MLIAASIADIFPKTTKVASTNNNKTISGNISFSFFVYIIKVFIIVAMKSIHFVNCEEFLPNAFTNSFTPISEQTRMNNDR